MSLDSASYSYATALLWMLNDYNTPHSVNLGSHQRDVFRNADQILKGYSTLSAQLLAKGENDLRD